MIDLEINKDAMRLVVAALRSGEYPQASGCLEINGGFCCMGVACRAYQAANPNDPLTITLADDGTVRYDTSSGFLPAKVMAWLGVDSDNMTVGYSDGPEFTTVLEPPTRRTIVATTANDKLKWNFAKIADKLEEYYELNTD